MIYLALSILFSSLLFIIFKWIGIRGLSSFPVIIVNYLVASILGIAIGQDRMSITMIFDSDWLWTAILLGMAFVFIFNLMAVVTHKFGTSVGVVANKMSLIIPVIFAFIFLNDTINTLKIIGIIMALTGVYLTMKKKDVKLKEFIFQLPVVLFFLSGLTDLSIKQIQHNYLHNDDILLFVPLLFLFAFLTGLVSVFFRQKERYELLKSQTIFVGIVLGILNYFSIYFIFRALALPDLESSVVFPLNNISIVLLASLFGLIFFKEKLQPYNYLGIGISVISILLIGLS